ncbi:SMP-30/gluconolactonase/LRE family protein [Achromobacter sp. NFACC18-2]|uniref:SMP-30/gluconolactonase/LRE family protein n=1 Tax=Achromobacter sp. NFACC18-2 TaxID=1564112 RepID=UPI0008B355C8|nr:SMP-30/gluconolactonase/LRE family protein [Achromobacter sp. NFACC18-2]SEJ71294.1 gluconolactonase [Achromobacter sp. NFACC18-2]
MWNMSFTPPAIIEATELSRLPDPLRLPRASAWAAANKPGHVVDSFLEGPVFDAQGRIYVTDIPHGRILCLDGGGDWHVVAQTGGWPNGLARHTDGSLWIADYRLGILRCEPDSGRIDTMLGHRNSESFKGVNDLVFDKAGRLYFTDQGQTGLHDPSGRVYRYDCANGRLDLLVANAPSPNGIALDEQAGVLYVAVTRANQVWRAPLLGDGSLSKMGAFQTFFGSSGPDGLALAPRGGLLVAHASLGGAFLLDARGNITHFLRSPGGQTVTNIAVTPDAGAVLMTESASGTLLQAQLPQP